MAVRTSERRVCPFFGKSEFVGIYLKVMNVLLTLVSCARFYQVHDVLRRAQI